MSKEQEKADANQKHFSFTYSLDPEDYFRLECSNCGLQFKVKGDAISITDALAPAFRQVEQEIGQTLTVTTGNNLPENNHLTCPYCGHSDKPANMNTQEFTDYAIRWLQREYVYDAINKFSREIGNMFKGLSSKNRGFINISVDYHNNTPPKPIQPISGPELPDMNRVELLCCEKTIKITDNWTDRVFCPYCSQTLILE